MDLRAWGLKETNLGIAVLNYSSIVMSQWHYSMVTSTSCYVGC